MKLISMAGTSKVFPLPSHGYCVKLSKVLPNLTPPDVQTTIPGLPLQVETLSLRKPTSLQKLWRKVTMLRVLTGNGYGKLSQSPRSNVSCGNATIKASQCALLQLLEEWMCLHCAQFVMKPLESIIHTLRDCRYVRTFQNYFSATFQPNLFHETNMLDWLRLNYCSSCPYSHLNIDWGIIFSSGLWSIWLHRNRIIVKNERAYGNLKEVTMAKATEFAFVGVNGKRTRSKTIIKVGWVPPPINWFKLNSDGSSLSNPSLAGVGGLIRDASGNWVKGYARAIRTTTSVVAKLWSLRDGIRLCVSLKL